MLVISAVLAVQLAAAPPPPPIDIAIERRVARELGLAVGDTLRVGAGADAQPALARVSAIYEPAADPATILRRDRRIRLHLPDLAALTGAPDRVDRLGVQLAPGTDPAAAAARLNHIAFGYRAYPSQEIASGSSQTFAVISRFHKAIGVITIVASAVFLLCIMLLKVDERRLDAAVMRFVGLSSRTIVLALLLEAALVAVVGSAIGVGIAWVASTLTNLYYQRLFETRLLFSLVTPELIAFGVGLSLLLGIGAGGLAALRLGRARPLDLWRRA